MFERVTSNNAPFHNISKFAFSDNFSNVVSSCSNESFWCSNSTDDCIAPSKVCNGRQDCPDGNDEAFELCGDPGKTHKFEARPIYNMGLLLSLQDVVQK